jgi:hypothetical protein
MGYDVYHRSSDSQQSGASEGACVIVTGHGNDATGAATKYLAAPGANHVATAAIGKLFVAPRAGTIKKLYVSATTAAGGSDTGVVTVVKSSDNAANFSDTALTATLSATGKSASDTANEVAVAAGDVLSVKVVSSAGTLAGVTASFMFV